jgi:hypothetical protein
MPLPMVPAPITPTRRIAMNCLARLSFNQNKETGKFSRADFVGMAGGASFRVCWS